MGHPFCNRKTTAIMLLRHAMQVLPVLLEPKRGKVHWDFLLEEMKWMATEFAKCASAGAKESLCCASVSVSGTPCDQLFDKRHRLQPATACSASQQESRMWHWQPCCKQPDIQAAACPDISPLFHMFSFVKRTTSKV